MPYQVLNGGKVPVKVFVDDLKNVESMALDQLRQTANLPWVQGVAAMPDVHYGLGATIGSVVLSEGAVSPSVVGVDIGCVDLETEFLSPSGWKKISEWSGEKVLSYDPMTNTAQYAAPQAYIRLPCTEFFHIKTKYGVDLMVDEGHRHLIYKYDQSYLFSEWSVVSTADIVKDHKRLKNGYRHRFNTSFLFEGADPGLDSLSAEQMRVMVMVCADGHFQKRSNTNNCIVRLRKTRKIERAVKLLTDAAIKFVKREYKGDTILRFHAPIRTKTLSYFWGVSKDLVKVVADEVLYWDGNLKDSVYFTRDLASADFVQFCFSGTGWRSVLRKDGLDYRVYRHRNVKIGIAGSPSKIEITRVPAIDGHKYCFTVDTGFFIIRRNGKVMVTGNCGMSAVKTPYKADQLKNLPALRHSIERSVPVGFNSNKIVTPRVLHAFGNIGIPSEFVQSRLIDRALEQLGTLGGGNHFIEICLDTEENVWIMLHSGSRNLGKTVAEHHISTAQGLMKEQLQEKKINKDLAALMCGTPAYEAYLYDLIFAQEYARANRAEMMLRVLKDLSYHLFNEDVGASSMIRMIVNCHHNYVELMGPTLILTRKGAVSARDGEYGIIPGSMGAKSFIVKGKGNPHSYCSCSHGAGRTMSRTQAKKNFTVADLEQQTAGVECRKDAGVLDEIPGAYKDIDEVMRNQEDLVEIVATLKQVLCVKG